MKKIGLGAFFVFLCGFGFGCPVVQKGLAPTAPTAIGTSDSAASPSDGSVSSATGSGRGVFSEGGDGGRGDGSGGGSGDGPGGGGGSEDKGEGQAHPATMAGTPYGGFMPRPDCLKESDLFYFENLESSCDWKRRDKYGNEDAKGEYVEVRTKIWLMNESGGVKTGVNCKGVDITTDRGTPIKTSVTSGAHKGCVYTRIFVPADRKQVPVHFSYFAGTKCPQDLQMQPTNVNGMQGRIRLVPEAYAEPPQFQGYVEAVYDTTITPEATTNVVTPCEITCKPFSFHPDLKAPEAVEMRREEMELRNCPKSSRLDVAAPSWCRSENEPAVQSK